MVVVPVVPPLLLSPGVVAGDPRVLLVVVVMAAAATVGEGMVLGRHRLLWGVPAVASLGTGCLAVGYLMVSVLTARDGDGSDIAVVPVLFVGIPVGFGALLVLSSVGYATASAARRARVHRHRRRAGRRAT